LTRPASANVLQQRGRFDAFVHRYSHDRPPQTLDMHTPASRYTVDAAIPGRRGARLPVPYWTAVITTCGRICYQTRNINVGQVFAGQKVGVRQVDEHVWLVTFMHYDLGYFDEPIDNPFGPSLLPISPE
jgi:putative transposase